MIETKIILKSVTDVKDFVTLANMCTGDVQVYSDRYIVDGKSIMGVMSLNLSDPIKVEIDGDIPQVVREDMKKFIVR